MIKKKLFLYIGISKPETNLLQSTLSKNSHLLRDEGIHYLDKFDNLSTKTSSANQDNGLVENIRTQLSEELKETEETDIQSYLIIDRVNPGSHNSTETSSLHKKILEPFALDTKIIFFLKRQDLFVEASFKQEIKNGLSISFEEYLEQLNKKDLNWNKILMPYSDRFGKKNILVQKFENKKDLILGFGRIIESNRIKYFSGLISKESYSNGAKKVIRLTSGYLSDQEQKEFHDLLNSIEIDDGKNNSSLFSDKQRADFLKNFDESNQKISAAFTENSEDLFSESSLLEGKTAAQEDKLSTDDVAIILTKAILKLKQHSEIKIKQLKEKHPLEKGILKIWKRIRSIF